MLRILTNSTVLCFCDIGWKLQVFRCGSEVCLGSKCEQSCVLKQIATVQKRVPKTACEWFENCSCVFPKLLVCLFRKLYARFFNRISKNREQPRQKRTPLENCTSRDFRTVDRSIRTSLIAQDGGDPQFCKSGNHSLKSEPKSGIFLLLLE